MKRPWQMNPTELHAHHQAQVAAITDMIDLAKAPTTEQERRHRGLIAHRSAPGDTRRLRYLPIHARGVTGVIPGTNPLAELLRQEHLRNDRQTR